MSKKWWNNLTPEQQQEYNATRNQRHRDKLSKMSPEELIAYKIKQREGWKRFSANLSPDEKKKLRETIKANARKKWANLPFEIKQKEKEAMKLRGKKIIEKQKQLVISHYSNGTMRCMNPKCEVPNGAQNILSLCIDHINGGGHQQAIELRKAGTIFYRWLIKNKFPSGYQVLCQNCNTIKKIEHKEDTGHKNTTTSIK